MAESKTHLKLKRAGARWLWAQGYAAVAEEVVVPGVGIVDVAGAGVYQRRNPRRARFTDLPAVNRQHAIFVECKAFRADFLRDQGRQMQFEFALREKISLRRNKRACRHRRASRALGKFDTCLLRPFANLHYLLTPPGLVRPAEIPRRWGWLVFDAERIRVVRKAAWVECAETQTIEGAIARALTARVMAATDDPPRQRPAIPSRGVAFGS